MPLPPALLSAVSQAGGGRVVLVLGAGCSFEPPTNLPLSRQLSREVYRQLTTDHVLKIDSADQDDLSSVADAVWTTTGSQREMIRRMPLNELRNANPNEGYRLAAAMLREQAISCVITLNFDLAMNHALSSVGARSDVATIAGPEDHELLSIVNLVYLHRSVNADPDGWILRSAALAGEWRGRWEEVIVQRFVSGPVTVFAGLGTAAAVLLETTQAIRAAIPEHVETYQVDPGKKENSPFFATLGIADDAYLQMGWGEFMRELATRLVEEHRAAIEAAGRELLANNRWDDEDIDDLSNRLTVLGLLGLGELRARWLLSESPYVPKDDINNGWIADLLLAIGFIERSTASRAAITTYGIVKFRRDGQTVGSVLVAHGSGIDRCLVVESKVKFGERHWKLHHNEPGCVIVSGVCDIPALVAPPPNLVFEEDAKSIVASRSNRLTMFTVDQIRATPALIDQFMG